MFYPSLDNEALWFFINIDILQLNFHNIVVIIKLIILVNQRNKCVFINVFNFAIPIISWLYTKFFPFTNDHKQKFKKQKKNIRKPYENNPLDKRQKYPQRTVFNI